MNFTTYENSKHLMTVNKCCVGLHTPPALVSAGSGETEAVHSLPPNAPRAAFLVDEYPACPAPWVRSRGRIKSYFVSVKEGCGLWLNFNDCFQHVPQHVAAVVSIQGVNAVTGLPCGDVQLEQYLDQCPRHKKPFGPDRYCDDCHFKWPKQNYLCTTGTPPGLFWLDGFRAADGMVRQYVLTGQKTRGVAQNLIGAERVFALGVSFFLSKTLRPQPVAETRRSFGSLDAMKGGEETYCADFIETASAGQACNLVGKLMSSTTGLGASEGLKITCASEGLNITCSTAPDSFTTGKLSAKTGKLSAKIGAKSLGRAVQYSDETLSAVETPVYERSVETVKTLEIAAGAKINQHVYDDPFPLDFWQAEPDGIVVINYCAEEDAERILAAGKVDVSGSAEGFLQHLPVGQPEQK